MINGPETCFLCIISSTLSVWGFFTSINDFSAISSVSCSNWVKLELLLLHQCEESICFLQQLRTSHVLTVYVRCRNEQIIFATKPNVFLGHRHKHATQTAARRRTINTFIYITKTSYLGLVQNVWGMFWPRKQPWKSFRRGQLVKKYKNISE